jgi:hypothetical protein
MSSLAIWRIIYCLSEIIKEQIEENTWGELKEIHRVNYKIQRENCKNTKERIAKIQKGELQFAPTRLTINH